MVKLTVYHHVANTRSYRVLVAARSAGLKVELGKVTEENLAQLSALNAAGQVNGYDSCLPALVVEQEGQEKFVVYQVNAILRTLARLGSKDNSLYGTNDLERAKIDSWLDFSVNEVDFPALAWAYHVDGFVSKNEQLTPKVKEVLERTLAAVNTSLQTSTFLVGDRLSLADIALSLSLLRVLTQLFGSAGKQQYPHVYRWFLTCMNQDQFVSIVGLVKFEDSAARTFSWSSLPIKGKALNQTPFQVLEVANWSSQNTPYEALIVSKFTSTTFKQTNKTADSNSSIQLDNGQSLQGSIAIARYLSRLSPAYSLYPTDAKLIAEVEQWVYLTQSQPKHFNDLASSLNTQLQSLTFLNGNTLLFSDIAAWASLKRRGGLNEEEKQKFPHLSRWFAFLSLLPVFQ